MRVGQGCRSPLCERFTKTYAWEKAGRVCLTATEPRGTSSSHLHAGLRFSRAQGFLLGWPLTQRHQEGLTAEPCGGPHEVSGAGWAQTKNHLNTLFPDGDRGVKNAQINLSWFPMEMGINQWHRTSLHFVFR